MQLGVQPTTPGPDRDKKKCNALWISFVRIIFHNLHGTKVEVISSESHSISLSVQFLQTFCTVTWSFASALHTFRYDLLYSVIFYFVCCHTFNPLNCNCKPSAIRITKTLFCPNANKFVVLRLTKLKQCMAPKSSELPSGIFSFFKFYFCIVCFGLVFWMRPNK